MGALLKEDFCKCCKGVGVWTTEKKMTQEEIDAIPAASWSSTDWVYLTSDIHCCPACNGTGLECIRLQRSLDRIKRFSVRVPRIAKQALSLTARYVLSFIKTFAVRVHLFNGSSFPYSCKAKSIHEAYDKASANTFMPIARFSLFAYYRDISFISRKSLSVCSVSPPVACFTG